MDTGSGPFISGRDIIDSIGFDCGEHYSVISGESHYLGEVLFICLSYTVSEICGVLFDVFVSL